jgi:hypothetical protein
VLIFLPNHNFICYKNSRHLEEYAGNTKYGIPNIKIIVNIRIYTLSDKIDYIIILKFSNKIFRPKHTKSCSDIQRCSNQVRMV